MTERAILSPLINTTPLRPPPTKYLSPATSRTAGVGSPATALINFNDQDEDQQRRERRRKSQAFEIHRKVLASPSAAAQSPADNLNGLTGTQLASHYADCIKLSTENKINSKNAFGLHLIDYMTELLKKKQLENFQVASSTLDASVKIYAGRVDNIHTSTYKVLAGLGGGKAVEEGEEINENEPGENLEAREVVDPKTKKKRKAARTIETNLKNINDDKYDLEFEVNPMFQVMSAAFDEGGARGLLLNRLLTMDEQKQLVLDSTTAIEVVEEAALNSSQPHRRPALFSDLIAKNENLSFDGCHICPSLEDFCFLNQESSLPKSFSEFAFDPTVDPPHVSSAEEDIEPLEAEEMYEADNMEANDGDDPNGLVSNFSTLSVRESHTAEFVESAMSDLVQGNNGKLRQMLLSEPSEFSYFNNVLMQAWAGPAHWRPVRTSKLGTKDSESKTVKKRTRKQPFKLTFDMTEEEIKKLLVQAKPDSICIKKKTWATYTKKRTTLPEDKQLDKTDQLFCLFIKPHIKIKPAVADALGVDDGIENYDLNNKNDVENFCPIARDEDEEDLSAAGFDLSNETNFVPASQDSSSQNDFNSLALNGTILTQDKLVAVPNKVQKIDIQYAKSAKRFDVKKLKSTMWSILTKDATEGTETVVNDAPVTEAASKMSAPYYFSQLEKTLPTKVSTTMAKNLTIQQVFACLLYITNEKNLKLATAKDMDDVYIEQDSV